jgi:hypothetical protein
VKARWAWRIILLAGLLAIAGRIGWTIVFPHPSGTESGGQNDRAHYMSSGT